MASGDLYNIEGYHYSRVPIDRVITGLCHIIVGHSTDEDDAVEKYYRNWGTPVLEDLILAAPTLVPNTTELTTSVDPHTFVTGDVVWIDGTNYYEGAWEITKTASNKFRIETPYGGSIPAPPVPPAILATVVLEDTNAPPIAAQQAAPFVGAQTVDPDREGYDLRLGDYDTFLFNVTAAVHLGSPVSTGSHTDPGFGYEEPTGVWFEHISHPKCQSFVRSTLLSRHNSAYGMAADFYKYGINTLEQSARTYGPANPGVGNMMHNGVYSDEDECFEKSFSTTDGHSAGAETNNNYFTPVYDIKFEAKHNLALIANIWEGDPAGPGYGDPPYTLVQIDHHRTTFYNLLVKIKLYSFDKSGDRDLLVNAGTDITGGTVVAHFRNRTNVYWQPFGETSELKFSTTEYTV